MIALRTVRSTGYLFSWPHAKDLRDFVRRKILHMAISWIFFPTALPGLDAYGGLGGMGSTALVAQSQLGGAAGYGAYLGQPPYY